MKLYTSLVVMAGILMFWIGFSSASMAAPPPTYKITIDWNQPYEGNYEDIRWVVRYTKNRNGKLRNSELVSRRVRKHPFAFLVKAAEGDKLRVFVRPCSNLVEPKCAKWTTIRGSFPAAQAPETIPRSSLTMVLVEPK